MKVLVGLRQALAVYARAMFAARRWTLPVVCVWLGCAPRPREQPVQNVVDSKVANKPRTELRDAAMALRDASLSKHDLSSIVSDDDRQVQLRFECVGQKPGSAALGRHINRTQLLTKLTHVRVSEELSCNETTRCCSFVRDPTTPKMQATLGSACFGTDEQLSKLMIVDEGACRG